MTDTLTPPIAAHRRAVDDLMAGAALLADWFDAHPEITTHQTGATWIVGSACDLPTADIVRAMKDGAPLSSITKTPSSTGETLFIERDFGGEVVLQHQVARNEVCEYVVTGTETVEVPDPEAPTVQVTRPVGEWRCSPILAGVDGGVA